MSGGGENKVGVGVGVAVGAARNEGEREEVEIREFVAFSVCKNASKRHYFLAPHFRAFVAFCNYEAIQKAFLRQLGKFSLFASC